MPRWPPGHSNHVGGLSFFLTEAQLIYNIVLGHQAPALPCPEHARLLTALLRGKPDPQGPRSAVWSSLLTPRQPHHPQGPFSPPWSGFTASILQNALPRQGLCIHCGLHQKLLDHSGHCPVSPAQRSLCVPGRSPSRPHLAPLPFRLGSCRSCAGHSGVPPGTQSARDP